MDLEQRVKALEYEIKILKNEIQRTLLDIQEQILVHYYPALRSEEAGPSDGTIQAMEAVRAKQTGTGGTAPGAPASGGSTGGGSVAAPPASTPPPPVPPPSASLNAPAVAAIPKVALDEVRPVQGQAQSAHDPNKAVKLVDWAMASGARIGGKRTDQLIELCRAKGHVTPDLKEMMAKITAINQGAAPESVPSNHILTELLKLLELLQVTIPVDEAMGWLEEAKLG